MHKFWLIAAIVAVSLASHLKGLASPMLDYHYHRQANTAAIARNFHENGLRFFHPQIDWEGSYRGRAATEFPLYMWLMGLFWPLFGLGDMWGRILSAIFSALTAVYLFKFLESKIEREAAFYAGILFSFIPLEIYFGRTVQPEAIALFSTMGALYHWDLSLQGRRPWGQWAAAIILCFLAVSHKLPYAYVLLPLAYLSWHHLKKAAFTDPRTLSACPLVILGVYAWYRYASAGVYVVPAHASEFLKILNYKRILFYIQFQILSRFVEVGTTYGGLALFFLGAKEIFQRKQAEIFLAWFAAVWIMIIAGGDYSFYHEYTSLPFAPVNAALMGLGLYALKEKISGRAWGRAALVLLVVSMPVHAALRIKHWYHINFAFLQNAQKAADAVSAPDDLFIGNERASSVYLYYLNRKGWGWDLAEPGEGRLELVEKKAALGAKFFMTHKSGGFENKDSVYSRHFYPRYPLVYDQNEILIFKIQK